MVVFTVEGDGKEVMNEWSYFFLLSLSPVARLGWRVGWGLARSVTSGVEGTSTCSEDL